MQISFIVLYLQHGRHGKHSIDTQAFVFGSKMPFSLFCSLPMFSLHTALILVCRLTFMIATAFLLQLSSVILVLMFCK